MSEPKNCPFCGKVPEGTWGLLTCSDCIEDSSLVGFGGVKPETWNTRPAEDELRLAADELAAQVYEKDKRIAALEAENATLREENAKLKAELADSANAEPPEEVRNEMVTR